MLKLLRNVSIQQNRHGMFSLLHQFSTAAVDAETATTIDDPYPIKPERLAEIAKSPSGWVERANPPPELPFDIERSRTNNLPVYVRYKNRRQTTLTTIRKVRGDIKELEKCVRSRLGDDQHYQINELTNQLHIKGNHREVLVRLLKELGF